MENENLYICKLQDDTVGFREGKTAGDVLDVRQCINILKRAGYDGYLSLEFEGLEDNLEAIRIGYAALKSFVG